MAQSVEAVIISGPRRGEIVQLTEDLISEVSEADLAKLNAGLDDVIAAIDRLSLEYHTSADVLRAKDNT